MSRRTPQVVVVTSAREGSEDRAIEEQLCAAGLHVRSADDLPSAIRTLQEEPPDVLVLARGAGDDVDDPEAVAQVRQSGFASAILVLGRRPDSSAAVAVLERGADDYVGFSCTATELVARVRALARRAAGVTALECEADGLEFDLRRGVIRSNGVVVALTRREADLLEYLARNTGRPVSRDELAAHIWHTAGARGGSTNVVDVYVSYLRRKLGLVGRQSLIRSVRGVGYELVDTRTG
ncbi:MAG: winged-helix domain-containing protein [Gemmatimonadaceae bacterium]